MHSDAKSTGDDPTADAARPQAGKEPAANDACPCAGDADAMRRINLLLWWVFSQSEGKD